VTFEQKLARLGYTLTPIAPDAGPVLHATCVGNVIYTSGQIPVLDGIPIKGKVGGDLTVEEGREAARICTVNCLRAIHMVIGSLNIFGMVNVAPGFDQSTAVIDACSDLLIDVFGNAGRHTRSAVGLTIPLNFAVEIAMIAEFTGAAATHFRALPP
jgi:enamine deaminase RidA (YjgF/YER057c/UK114 family)